MGLLYNATIFVYKRPATDTKLSYLTIQHFRVYHYTRSNHQTGTLVQKTTGQHSDFVGVIAATNGMTCIRPCPTPNYYIRIIRSGQVGYYFSFTFITKETAHYDCYRHNYITPVYNICQNDTIVCTAMISDALLSFNKSGVSFDCLYDIILYNQHII